MEERIIRSARVLAPLTLVALLIWLGMVIFYAPLERAQGVVQKIFYVHLPAAINAFLACMVAFVGGVGYLWQRRMMWDSLSAAVRSTLRLSSEKLSFNVRQWAEVI